MEKLNEDEKFTIYKKGDDLEDYLREFVIWVEKQFSEIIRRINWQLNRLQTNGMEFIKPGNTGEEQDGNLKLLVDSNGDLKLQYRTGGAWADSGWKVKFS